MHNRVALKEYYLLRLNSSYILGYAYAATPPIQPRPCILTDYFNNYNFSKAQIIRSLMMVIKPKHVGAV
jgi:hypothetical protein